MGTPDFAVPSLDMLVENGYNIVGVITAPDKPAGRGRKLSESAVKKYAVSKGLHLLQPTNLKSPGFIEELRALEADLQIVVAFRMLPEVVWNMPPLGTFNLHASLLPNYRGAAPINRAVMDGATQTGMTTFMLRHEIDTGNILFQETISIGPEETAGELHDRMMVQGAQLVLKTVQAIGSNNYPLIEQVVTPDLQKAPKIHKEDCEIDWDRPLDEVYNHIRGLSPFPTAWTTLDGKVLKVFRAAKEVANHGLAPGTLQSDSRTYLKYAVPGGFIHLADIRLEGKKRLRVADFLRGYNIETV